LFLTSCKSLDKLAEKILYPYKSVNKDFPVKGNPAPDFVDEGNIAGSTVWHKIYTNSDKPIIFYLPGNGESLRSLNSGGTLETLNQLGEFAVLDLPGYGASKGKPAEEEIMFHAVTLYEYLTKKLNRKVILWGRSLGAAIAMQIAWYEGDFDRLILISPWTDLKTLLPEINPLARYISEDFYKKNRYQSILFAKRTIGRTLVIHGRNDTFIGVHHGREMSGALFGGFIEVESGHNDIYEKKETWDAIKSFLK
jgi:pimeloyl-ACP methyl ester carboxylesterase